jgi:hypothetical protein
METKADKSPLRRPEPHTRDMSPAERDDKQPRLVHAPTRIPAQRVKKPDRVKYPADYWLG